MMTEDSELLDEVVVVGYGTMKKSDLTGSVTSIKSEELMKTNPVSINQSLQGRIAGVQVNQNDGARELVLVSKFVELIHFQPLQNRFM